jgi:hypothetical protein
VINFHKLILDPFQRFLLILLPTKTVRNGSLSMPFAITGLKPRC